MKFIKGYEGRYSITDDGRVFSHLKNKYLALGNFKGYRQITLYKKGEERRYSVHRLVAEAFIPNPDGLPCVNHKDENPSNNHYTNLEWCTIKYNNNYGNRNKKMIATRAKRNPNNECYWKTVKTRTATGCSNAEKPVVQFSLKGEYIAFFKSTAEAERKTGCRRDHIRRVCNGGLLTTGGFVWKWVS